MRVRLVGSVTACGLSQDTKVCRVPCPRLCVGMMSGFAQIEEMANILRTARNETKATACFAFGERRGVSPTWRDNTSGLRLDARLNQLRPHFAFVALRDSWGNLTVCGQFLPDRN